MEVCLFLQEKVAYFFVIEAAHDNSIMTTLLEKLCMQHECYKLYQMNVQACMLHSFATGKVNPVACMLQSNYISCPINMHVAIM